MHCEPAPGGSAAGPGRALVIIQPAPAHPGPDLLRQAATRIGTTLDLTRTAREVTEVAVPAFAAAATIFVSEPLLTADDVAARRAGSAAVLRRLAARLAGQPPAVTDSVLRPGEVLVFDGASPSFRAMSTGQPVRSGHLGQENVNRLTRRPGGHQIAAGYTTFLAVPLAPVWCWAARPSPGPPDPGFEPVTSRWPPTGHPGRGVHRQRPALRPGAADRVRPPARPAAPRAAYPGGDGGRAPVLPGGGERGRRGWHDIVRLPAGRAALIVGDAMGHGPEAAAVMVQLRTAAHTLAGLDLPPEDILHRLDRMAAGMPAAPFATCICAVIDLERNSCVIAKAGHPPPLLARPGRAPQVLDLAPGSRSASAPGPSRRPKQTYRPGPSSPCTPTAWWRAASGRWTRVSPRWVPPWARRWPRPAARSTPAAKRSPRPCASAATMTSRWCWRIRPGFPAPADRSR